MHRKQQNLGNETTENCQFRQHERTYQLYHCNQNNNFRQPDSFFVCKQKSFVLYSMFQSFLPFAILVQYLSWDFFSPLPLDSCLCSQFCILLKTSVALAPRSLQDARNKHRPFNRQNSNHTESWPQ